MKKILLALAATAALGSAQASPLVINNGVDWAFDGDSSTKTAVFNNLGFTGSTAVAVVYDPSLAVGSKVVTSNDAAYLSSTFGITGSFAVGNVNIDALNTTTDGNGFSNAQTFPYGTAGTWGLTYLLTLEGTLEAGGFVNYTKGTIDLFYQDGGAAKKVAVLKMGATSNGTNNQLLTGGVDFSFVSGLDTASADFVKAFWEDATTGKTLYETWATDPVTVNWILNNNNTPNAITTGDDFTSGSVAYKRTTITSNGDLTFNVPEPGSIALVGLALTGLAVASRRRKQA